jgi:putative phosphoesterase
MTARLARLARSARVVVLSDTHIRRGGSRRLSDAAYRLLEGAAVILHAGDVVCVELLDELGGFAPTYAVLGNNDFDPGLSYLPDTRLVSVEGVDIGMVHDSGPAAGRAARLRRLFPLATVVVFGHSHIPWNETGLDGQVLFNPGSPTERRMQPVHTMGVLELADGAVLRREIVPV